MAAAGVDKEATVVAMVASKLIGGGGESERGGCFFRLFRPDGFVTRAVDSSSGASFN